MIDWKSNMKKAFLTGITGQDGSYLAELLLEKGYEVHAILRRSSVFNTKRIDKILNHDRLKTYHGDLTDSSNLHRLIKTIEPDEIYNLGAQSHVAVSFEVPEYTGEATGIGTLRLLDAVRDTGLQTKFYQASTSELFGGFPETVPQNEDTKFYPRSPYATAKLYAYWMTVNYRESYNLFAINGILFNHESPRRGETFVTKKITKGIANIVKGKQKYLELGNLNAKRDWGHAKDFVVAMWLMMQQQKPDDFVIATGKAYSVREFVEKAFSAVNIEIIWQGKGTNEVGLNSTTGEELVKVNKEFYRPSEVEFLLGDAGKAKKILGWSPKYDLDSLIQDMMDYDLKFDDYGYN